MVQIRSIILIAAIAASVAAPAGAQSLGVPNSSDHPPSGSPIQIEDCKAGQDGGMLLAQSDGNFEIVFTNEGGVVADLVRFQVDLGQERLFIRDAGKFSPGVTISHRYRRRGGNVVSSPLFSPVKLQCTVAAVHFVDGSEWTPPGSSAAPTPTPNPVLGDGFLGVVFKQQADGVYAQLVLPASPAQNAGIEQGDRITKIESNAIATVNDAIELISATPPGARLHLTVMRDGRRIALTAVIGKRPATAQ